MTPQAQANYLEALFGSVYHAKLCVQIIIQQVTGDFVVDYDYWQQVLEILKQNP